MSVGEYVFTQKSYGRHWDEWWYRMNHCDRCGEPYGYDKPEHDYVHDEYLCASCAYDEPHCAWCGAIRELVTCGDELVCEECRDAAIEAERKWEQHAND